MNFKTLIYTFLILTISSCATPKYVYTLKLKDNDDNKFDNALISANFDWDSEGVSFNIKNKTSSMIKVIWDESSITIFDQAHNVAHEGIKYSLAGESQVPSTIPPNSFIRDNVVPVKNINYNSPSKYSSGGWTVKPILPIKDNGTKKSKARIMGYIGKEVGLFIPMEINGERKEYFFKFIIKNIVYTKPILNTLEYSKNIKTN